MSRYAWRLACGHLSNPCAKNVQISTNIMQEQRFFEKNKRNVWWNWFFSLPLHPHSENECCEVKEPKDWKFGWVAETSSLLNCRTGNRTGGSNPPASATVDNQRWSVHLTVRIQDSQSWHKGSIPLPTTSYILIDLVLHQTCGQGFLVSRNLMVDSSNG